MATAQFGPNKEYTYNIDASGTPYGAPINTITTAKLTPETPMVLPNAKVPTDYNSASELITKATESNKVVEAKAAKDSALADVNKANLDLAGQSKKQDEYFVAEGGDIAKKQADEYTSQIEAEQLATRRAVDELKLNPNGLSAAGLQTQINELNTKSISKQADLAILQNAALRKYDTASAIAARKVAAETDYLKAALETKKLIYEDNKDAFTIAEQRQIDANIKAEERAYNETVKTKTDINNVLLEAAKNQAPASVISKISSSKTQAEAIAVAGSWMSDPLDREIKELQKKKLKQDLNGAEAPTIKTINGVDMEWDPKTKSWVTPNSATGKTSKEAIDKSLSQLSFLKSTANSITGDKEIYGASGRSGARKFTEGLFVGATDYTKLESLANTLKVNVLALMTDPTIKKFFGPQMSNADVTLMTSAGTTINPELQDPESIKTEVTRLQDLFDRMEKSVKAGTQEYQYVDTIAPAIDKSGTALSPSSYANSLLEK